MKKKKDGRKNNGGHATGGRKHLTPQQKKLGIMIYLSEEQFLHSWETVVCEQFKEKFEIKLKNICDSIK